MIIGLTGGIASGKTLVSRYLEKKGLRVIDADVLSRQAVAPNSAALEEIVRAFGRDCLMPDGSLNRQRMARRVFSDKNALERLNAILHPAIFALAEKAAAEVNPDEIAFLVVPLLYEAGFDRLCDAVWVVVCDESVRLRRLLQRDGISTEEAEARIRAQMSDEERLRRKPVVLHNDAAPAALYAQVDMNLAKLGNMKNNA